jgi:hypothetical protein
LIPLPYSNLSFLFHQHPSSVLFLILPLLHLPKVCPFDTSRVFAFCNADIVEGSAVVEIEPSNFGNPVEIGWLNFIPD